MSRAPLLRRRAAAEHVRRGLCELQASHLLMAHGPQELKCDSAVVTSGERLRRGAGQNIGVADSKSGILSMWLRFDSGTLEQGLIRSDAGGLQAFEANRAAGPGRFEIIGLNAAETTILVLPTTATFAAGATWYNFLASWDLATGAAHLYVNDVSDVGVTTLTNDTIDYATSDQEYGFFGNPVSGGVPFIGAGAECYFNAGAYLDLSQVHNRRKFISARKKPVFLGTDGALPTGTIPQIYLHLDDAETANNFATNRGSGGGFTIAGGDATLQTGSTSPSD